MCTIRRLWISKGKVVPVRFLTEHHAMKAYWGSEATALHILDLRNRWRGVVSFTLWRFYSQGKSPWYPLDRRLGGPQNRFRGGGEEKNSQPLPKIEPPIIDPAAQRYTAELSRILMLMNSTNIWFSCFACIFGCFLHFILLSVLPLFLSVFFSLHFPVLYSTYNFLKVGFNTFPFVAGISFLTHFQRASYGRYIIGKQ
jgi:hypothetical protein